MSFENIMLAVGGILLFLFGMRIISGSLKKIVGVKMKMLLNKITKNKLYSILTGCVVSSLIQSSTVVTVMVVGFVNAELLNLLQAAGIIMGANVGTTVTSLIIALNIFYAAPAAIVIGFIMISFFKKHEEFGKFITGFGILFLGMYIMTQAFAPLEDSRLFNDFVLQANAFEGFLIGMFFTAVIQSSSAGVGILQALAIQGLMPVKFAAFIICGQNIGTVATTLISSIGASTNAKRAAMIHLLFNIFSAVLFAPIFLFTPIFSWLNMMSGNTALQISVIHILLNVVTVIVLYPFTEVLVKISERMVRNGSRKRSAGLDSSLPAKETARLTVRR